MNATALMEQLGTAEAAVRAIEGFIDVFATSMPTGKQNTFAAHSLPSTVVVSVRDDRPISWMGAFERPVPHRRHPDAPVEGYVAQSARRMFAHGAALDKAYGAPLEPPIVLVADDRINVGDEHPTSQVTENLKSLQTRTGEILEQLLEQE